MKIVEQSAELIDDVDGAAILKKIERCGRVCYQSQPKDDSAENFVRMLIKRGHESVLEHESLTFRIVTSRGIMSELTRHRLCAFSDGSKAAAQPNRRNKSRLQRCLSSSKT